MKQIFIIAVFLLMLLVGCIDSGEQKSNIIYLYEVSFDANGGKGQTQHQVLDYNAEVILPSLRGFSRSGYVATGWSDSTTSNVPLKSFRVPNYDSKLYVVWQSFDIKINFDANGGIGSLDSIFKKANSKVTLPSTDSFIRKGYTAVGWSINHLYTAGFHSFNTAEQDVTLYVIWQPNADQIAALNFSESRVNSKLGFRVYIEGGLALTNFLKNPIVKNHKSIALIGSSATSELTNFSGVKNNTTLHLVRKRPLLDLYNINHDSVGSYKEASYFYLSHSRDCINYQCITYKSLNNFEIMDWRRRNIDYWNSAKNFDLIFKGNSYALSDPFIYRAKSGKILLLPELLHLFLYI